MLRLVYHLFGCAPATTAANARHLTTMSPRSEITVAGGCFWCIEACFSRMKGVDSAISGYIGGRTTHPTYDQVCSGGTGHAEAVKITWDPETLPLSKVLKIFFTVHDPTTLNRQGNDAGTQYRSAVYCTSEEQRDAVRKFIAEEVQPELKDPVVTEVVFPYPTWYRAEEYHQDYFEKNPNAGYCQAVVKKKVAKAAAAFPQLLK